MRFTEPAHAAHFFRTRLRGSVEEFWAAALNSDKRVIAARRLFRGTVDRCLFHPRDVYRFACSSNASSIVVAHNHPSGDVRPSDADVQVTAQLMMCSLWLEIPLLDHLIVSDRGYYSFLSDGRLEEGIKDLAWTPARAPD